jgi:hypothetical protein
MIRILILLFLTLKVSGQVPYGLNSFPSAKATFYLDFDGQTVNTPYWNKGVPFYATPSKLTASQMDSAFKIVAEDFRPFNVNVTTDSAVYFAAPLLRRQRVIITDTSEWYAGVGGVAYFGSFIWGLEVPCFVFTDILKTGRNSSEAISHEIGHTLNLYHQSQCNSTGGFVFEYNPGRGVGETSWSPIMGDSYSRNLTVWHNGPTSFGCTSLQDDLAVITSSTNGFGYRPDGVGNTIELATPISINVNTVGFSELINRTNDTDFYRIILPKRGRLILTANPYNLGGNRVRANIDIEMSLYNGTTLLQKYNPLTRLNAVLDTTLNTGIYHISINNVANANISNYGMIGSYSVEGTFTVEEALNLDLPNIQTQIQRQIELINISGNSNTGIYQINLPNRNNFTEIRIYSITGTLLKSIRNIQKINTIDISKYSSGIYIVNIDNVKSFKIIKQ